MTPDEQRRRAAMAPVIPEIAKAFQNDPRTQLAAQAVQNGSSGAPVAQGGYAWGDGIARALQGIAGGYITRKQMQRYGQDEQDLLHTRQLRGEDGSGVLGAKVGQKYGADGLDAVPGAMQPPAGMGAPMVPPQAMAQPPAGPPQMPQSAPVSPEAAQQMAAALAPSQPPAGPPQPSPTGAVDPLRFAPPAPPQGGPMTPPFSTRAAPARQAVQFVDPLAGAGRPTSGFGPRKAPIAGASTMHGGQDYAAPTGTPVRAAADGTVIRAWSDTKSGGGNSVLIRHPDGSVTGYAHLADFNVQRGDPVHAGQPIGAVGSTGRATGPHLHFTYRDPSGRKVDPTKSLKFGEVPETVDQNTINVQGAVPPSADGTSAMPPAPAEVARPNAPVAEPATRSRTLDGAYRIMRDGNRYESATGQEMYQKGLTEQQAADEAAAERRQRLADMGYQSDLGVYANDKSQRTNAAWDARSQTRQHNWSVLDREDQQQFQHGENQNSIAQQQWEAKYGRETQYGALDKQQQYDRWKTQTEIEGKLQQAEETAKTRRSNFFATAAGAKMMGDARKVIGGNTDAISTLKAFEDKLSTTKTGGFTLGNAPGLVRWSNSDLQYMESMSNQLALAARQNMPGSLSDSDREFLKQMVPSIRSTGRANKEMITRLRGMFERQNEYAIASMEATASGSDTQFLRQWQQYTHDVPSSMEGPNFQAWQSRPRFDANGKRVQ